jgi:predicted anti-sigma-YlaC factor YlaD
MSAKHWTEEQLIAHLYGIGPEGDHLAGCVECRNRLAAMQQARLGFDAEGEPDAVSAELLAAQRREIYRRAASPAHASLWRWLAPIAVAFMVLVGVLFVQRPQQQNPAPALKPSDTQLVEDMGRIAFSSEPAPVAPLQGLFE